MEFKLFTPRKAAFSAERAMAARFDSECAMCKGDICEGDPIYYAQGSGARHQNCCEQTGRTLAQIVVDYINASERADNAYTVYSMALRSTFVRSNKDFPLVIDSERTRVLPEAWAVFVDGSALRPIEGDAEKRFETFDPQ